MEEDFEQHKKMEEAAPHEHSRIQAMVALLQEMPKWDDDEDEESTEVRKCFR
ncbi:hypothetical protein D8674_001733 [Pyrus ussuriensis x Pyrus communis]|uniref:Uncharacterized protein n=1 Tax=Pyrus ussuriensis x Pyrus communis TaxID=2448454 RepID=A0A5N5F7Q9_9ROSA|nr:hypothetical protein D8674_001733 [Pyrus ussuriensis x Pyrus communis]